MKIEIGIETRTKTVLNTILYRKGEIKLAISRSSNDWQIGRFTREELIELKNAISEYLKREL